MMISKSKESLRSKALATSVGTNASHIRKVIAFLKNAVLIRYYQEKTVLSFIKYKLFELNRIYTLKCIAFWMMYRIIKELKFFLKT